MNLKDALNFGIHGLWTQVLDAGLWMLDYGGWALDSGPWKLHFGRWALDNVHCR